MNLVIRAIIGIALFLFIIYAFAVSEFHQIRLPIIPRADQIEYAISAEEIERGLMYRHPCARCGMVFVFNKDTLMPFWMKNTPIDLDIAFIDSEGVVQEIQRMQSETLESHIPKKPYRYALEMPAGGMDKIGISINTQLEFMPNKNMSH